MNTLHGARKLAVEQIEAQQIKLDVLDRLDALIAHVVPRGWQADVVVLGDKIELVLSSAVPPPTFAERMMSDPTIAAAPCLPISIANEFLTELPEGSDLADEPLDVSDTDPAFADYNPDLYNFDNPYTLVDAPAAAGISPETDRQNVNPLPVAPASKSAPWSRLFTPGEDSRMLQMADEGATYAEIGAALGRSEASISVRLVRVRKGQRPKSVAKVTLTPPVRAEVVVSPDLERRPAEPAPVLSIDGPNVPATIVEAPPFEPPSAGRAALELDARLDALGNKGKWSDIADDLALVEGLTKGEKLAQIAIDLGIDAAVCKFRFAQLVPVPGIKEQADVIAALRRRMGLGSKPGVAA
jgi:hypothetical protein